MVLRLRSLLTGLILTIHLVSALKFDLFAQPPKSKTERCIRNFVNSNTLVMVTATLDKNTGSGQTVNIQVCPIKWNNPQGMQECIY